MKKSLLSVCVFKVEQQYSHKLKVKVLRAENVTKGALGDLCELWNIICFKYLSFSKCEKQ